MDDRLHVPAILAEMDDYAKAAGIAPATIGKEAGQGGQFYGRLMAGKRAWPETIAKVRAYMAANPPTRRGRGRNA